MGLSIQVRNGSKLKIGNVYATVVFEGRRSQFKIVFEGDKATPIKRDTRFTVEEIQEYFNLMRAKEYRRQNAKREKATTSKGKGKGTKHY